MTSKTQHTTASSAPVSGASATRRYEYVLSLVLPALILAATFAARGIYPFGTLSVAIEDQNIQYVGFYSWLSEVMHGNGSLLYSATQGLGEGTAALIAYYLASPFSLLAAFFDPMDAPQLLSLMTLVKLPFAGLTCYTFLRRRYGAGTMGVALSLAYALSGYVLLQCSNIMWMDGVIMLPLVALGTWRAARGERLWPLFASVACVVLFNWYVGFMCCLFSACYFLACCYIDKLPSRVFVKRGVRYAIAMLLALGASMVLFLPSALGLMSGANTDMGSSLYANLHANPSNFVAYYCMGYTGDELSPGVYLTSMAPILALSLFFNRKVPRRLKVGLGVLALFLLSSFFLFPLDVLWSALKLATSFYFRYAFVFDFVVVVLAIEGYRRLFELDRRENFRVLAKSTFLFGLLIGLAIMDLAYYSKSMPFDKLLCAIQFVLISVFALLLHIRTRAGGSSPADLRFRIDRILSRMGIAAARAGRVCVALMLALVMVEHGMHAYLVFGHYENDVSNWSTYVSALDSTLSGAQSDDGAELRVGIAGRSYTGEGPTYAPDPSGFGRFQTMAEYTSTQAGSTSSLFSALGYTSANDIYGFYYDSPMLAADALMGVDYTISSVQTPGTSDTGVDSPLGDGYKLYSNDYALPLAYAIAGGGNPSFGDNPFENQEVMYADVTGSDASSLYEPADVQTTGGSTSDTYRTWTITATQTGPLYLTFPSISESKLSPICHIYINGHRIAPVSNTFWGGARYAGEFAEGEQITVTLSLSSSSGEEAAEGARCALWSDCDISSEEYSSLRSTTPIIAESLDMDVFEQLYSQVQTTAQVQSFEDGHVVLSNSSDADGKLLLSIPYDKGWSATVDGQPVEVERCYSGLCGVQVNAGEHVVELTYTTPGLAAGAVASVASVAAFAVWRAMARRRRSASEKA